MKPYNNFKAIVFTSSTAILFLCWTLMYPYLEENPTLGLILGGLISFGSYRIILKAVELLFLNIKFVKRKILGNIYLEGTWVGCYIGLDNQPKFFIECFEQTLDELIIRGRCFREDYIFKGTWTSDTVIIDEKKGSISYTYETDMIGNVHKNQGLAVFSFVRSEKAKAPTKMFGYSSDIFVPRKTKSLEVKILNPAGLEDSDLLREAHKVYEQNNYYFYGIESDSSNPS